MNTRYQPVTSLPTLAAGLTLVIALALSGMAGAGGATSLPVGSASGGHALAARPLQTPTPVPGSWTPTGGLNDARWYHTATLLPSGEVLVVGGWDGSPCCLSSAELYDPATGLWRYTGSLNTPRAEHTATLLPSGRVLIAGGIHCTGVNCTILDTAEVYDPATETWTYTGRMNDDREYHTATLLSNGKVLVAGDIYGLASAELYDPATERWTYTGRMNEGRSSHTATLLPNGQVLVAGGCGSSGCSLASAELYDPATGTWTTTGSLHDAREQHTATLLPGGWVLVAGGYGGPTSGDLSSAELFDSATGTWIYAGNLNTARTSPTATLLPNGHPLIVGGISCSDINCTALDSAEVYKFAIGLWSYTGSLNEGRYNHTATLLPIGQVLVAGGKDSSYQPLSSAELYSPRLPTLTLHVADITPFYQPQGGRYLVGARITIQDSNNAPVPGASVTVTITLPSGNTLTFTNTTNTSGRVIFRQLVRETGTYTFCVEAVSKPGWTYDPSQNVETCDSVTIP